MNIIPISNSNLNNDNTNNKFIIKNTITPNNRQSRFNNLNINLSNSNNNNNYISDNNSNINIKGLNKDDIDR